VVFHVSNLSTPLQTEKYYLATRGTTIVWILLSKFAETRHHCNCPVDCTNL